ncbi:hypothetical protein LZ554_007111 [Drepanopeziza brunnea f. sp. 'monogermtubi']|nr:hypothetical protein LZ554_007111 [Drepanopeziza brunnea f. sp. 'monogermtubi']
MKLFSSFALLGFAIVAESAKVSYDGAKAIRIPVGEDVTPLMEVIQQLDLPVWKGARHGVPRANSNVDLVVPAEKVREFEELTATMNTEIMHEDLGASIAAEGTAPAVSNSVADLTWFNAYHAYADHLTFLRDLVALYPTRAEIVISGASTAGRLITGIHFWGSAGKGIKPAIVLYATAHAREWITTMTSEYLAYYLLTNYAGSAEIKGFVDKYDFYIFPVVNPDGTFSQTPIERVQLYQIRFVYSQTTDRLWRKNRQNVSTSTCVGRDLNRNWPFHPCDDDYKGLAAADGTETKVLLAYINKIAAAQTVQLYIDIHSYAQLFMTLPTNNATLQTLARGAASAIGAVYGTSYVSGPICNTIYPVTGCSVDYVNDVTRAKHVFTIELRDTGLYGFVLPASQILPTGVETWAGLRYLLLNMT